MSEMSPETSVNVSQGGAPDAVPVSSAHHEVGKIDIAPESTGSGAAPGKGVIPAGDRLQFLERLVATHDDLRKAYQQAFEAKSDAEAGQVQNLIPQNLAAQAKFIPHSGPEISLSSPMDLDRMVSEISVAADQAYHAKLEESHEQVVGLFDKLMPGMASLVEAKSKTEGQKAFLGHLEELFEQALIQTYPPKLWFNPKTHQELVGRLVPVARQLAREMGLLTPEGAFKFAYSRQTAGANKPSSAQGAATQAGYVEPSSQNTPVKERAFDKAFREKDTLAMVRALFRRNT